MAAFAGACGCYVVYRLGNDLFSALSALASGAANRVSSSTFYKGFEEEEFVRFIRFVKVIKYPTRESQLYKPYEPYKLYERKGLFALYLMSCSRFDDFEEICCFQGCTTDKSTIHVRIGENSVGISSITASSVKD